MNRLRALEFPRSMLTGITITVNVWTNAHGFYDTRVALNEKIVNDLKAAGVKVPGNVTSEINAGILYGLFKN